MSEFPQLFKGPQTPEALALRDKENIRQMVVETLPPSKNRNLIEEGLQYNLLDPERVENACRETDKCAAAEELANIVRMQLISKGIRKDIQREENVGEGVEGMSDVEAVSIIYPLEGERFNYADTPVFFPGVAYDEAIIAYCGMESFRVNTLQGMQYLWERDNSTAFTRVDTSRANYFTRKEAAA